ncbi:S41 family peptidase [Paraflavitalea sp. CAU 1676]|uniref:S41 family peptidase n=1 Tax=Paraflavitalea sp. CAU 1676 TaxID=3032598 RepID=UPI0023DA8FCB|nr:S41 family peptidase [Paraflavitalea sp. CAU 1676]MDF2192485.1 S41 family peptidase [Paraflavitalea sp. CAU 1676]
MRNMLSALVAILFLGQVSLAQVPDSVRLFVDSALTLMQKQSVFSSKVNWLQVRDSVGMITRNARTYDDVFPAVRYAFNQLGDRHGFLLLGGQQYKNPDPALAFDTTRLTANIKLAASKGPRIYAGVVDKQFTYISIPFFGGQSATEARAFAQRIQDSLCRYTHTGTRGVIIDLRLNAGGNLFPMVAGVANVLGAGLYSEGVDASGKVTGASMVKQGAVEWYDSIPLKAERGCGDLSKLPVALIVGPVTASAGEMMAVAFTGRPRSVVIGEPTGGYVTSNDGRYLPGKGNAMVLAMEYVRDRNGKAYVYDVVPGIKVVGGDDYFNHSKDKKIQAAVKWLRKTK